MKAQRLTGVDLFRGIAIYAVIVLHSDEPLSHNPVGWETILEFSKFAVPFFLATSFYLTVRKFYSASKEFSLGARLFRLLAPYGIWSAIYVIYKCLKYILDGDINQIGKILQNWFSIVFFGGAAFHLYFLPLLMAGTILMKVIEVIFRKNRRLLHPIVLLPAVILSFGIYQSLLATNNTFNNGPGTAFSSFVDTSLPAALGHNLLLRAGLVLLAWMIRCLPYILLAMLIAHPKLNSYFLRKSVPYCLLLIGAFTLINLFGFQILPSAVNEIFRGYVTLALALAVSPFITDNFWLKSLGACSFGIYLMHLVFVEGFYIVVGRVLPTSFSANISSVTLLIVSSFILLVTGFLTQMLRRKKQPALIFLGG